MGQLEYVKALTIAGSDSGGGAGIQADIKTMSALGVYAASAVTAVTVQNTLGVSDVHAVPPAVVEAQIRSVMDDIRPTAIKIGMVYDADSMRAIVQAFSHYAPLPIVLDTVMVSSSGSAFMQAGAFECLRDTLLPIATLVTPNLPEAARLAGMDVRCLADMDAAARRIAEYNPGWLLIKGGHLNRTRIEDRLYKNGELVAVFGGMRVETTNTHGTGCTLSAAIAAYLAMGHGVPEAVERARDYVQQAIAQGACVITGRGFGPVNHLFAPVPLQAKASGAPMCTQRLQYRTKS